MTRLKQISEQVVARFGAAHRTLGTAESLTGGMIASSVAGVSGASAVLMGGVVSYDPRVKHEVLGVSQQVIDTVGVMYGNPETTTGGRALKFYASVRLDVRRGEQLKNGSEVIGNRTKVKVVKNKVAPPFKVAEFDIIYGEGISKFGSLLDMAVERDIIHKSGAWFSYEDQRIGQGRENARQYLRDHPELADRIEKIVREEAMAAASNNAAEPPAAAASEEEDPDLALMDEIEE